MNENQIKEFRQKILKQLEEARQQKLFWIKKLIALEGSLSACDYILQSPKNGLGRSPEGIIKDDV